MSQWSNRKTKTWNETQHKNGEKKKTNRKSAKHSLHVFMCRFSVVVEPFFSLTLNSVFPAKHFQHLITNENRIANKYGNRYLQFSGLLMEPEQ